MAVGIRKCFDTVANLVVTNSAALITTGLTAAIAVNQRMKIKVYIPFSVGATGGVRVQIVTPAGIVVFTMFIQLNNTVAPAVTVAQQVASAAFTNALANAGNHCLELEGEITCGATGGNIDVQIAQNTADALSLTVLRGAWMEVTTL